MNASFLLQVYSRQASIDSDSIKRIEAMGSYNKFFFCNGKTLLVARTMGWFDGCLPLLQFILVHRAHVVNKKYIGRYVKGAGGKVQMLNGEQIIVAHRKKECFTQLAYV